MTRRALDHRFHDRGLVAGEIQRGCKQFNRFLGQEFALAVRLEQVVYERALIRE
jgi:hypothetical protein